jgi:hypothetical protein
MSPGQYEQLIRSAATVDVTSIQTANIPRVSGDQSFAMINGWECPPSDLLRLFNAAQSGKDADGTGSPVNTTASRAAPVSPRQSPKPTAPQSGSTPRTPSTVAKRRQAPKQPSPQVPPHHTLVIGARVAVDRSAYPDESCTENGGLAYGGTVTGLTPDTAKITFDKISRRTKTNYRGNVPFALVRLIT